jgi:hypothetical protein
MKGCSEGVQLWSSNELQVLRQSKKLHKEKKCLHAAPAALRKSFWPGYVCKVIVY